MKNNFKSKLIVAVLLVAITYMAIMPSAGALAYSGQYNGKSYIFRGTQSSSALSATMEYETRATLAVDVSANVRILKSNGTIVNKTFADTASIRSISLSYSKLASDLPSSFIGNGVSGYVFTNCTYVFKIDGIHVETMSL